MKIIIAGAGAVVTHLCYMTCFVIWFVLVMEENFEKLC